MTYLKNFQPKVNMYFLTIFFSECHANFLINLELVCKTNEEDVNVWEDNWDDDAVEDDFSVQLR